MGSSIVYVKVFEFAMPNISWMCESCGLTLRIVNSIGELLLLIYKSGFYRWE